MDKHVIERKENHRKFNVHQGQEGRWKELPDW